MRYKNSFDEATTTEINDLNAKINSMDDGEQKAILTKELEALTGGVVPEDLNPVESSGLKADILRGVEKDHAKELDKIKKIEQKIKKQQELITQVQALDTCEFNKRLIHDTRDKIKDLKAERIKAIKAADAVVELYADINNGKIGGF